MMGAGHYGHASAILLKGQEKAAATRAKKKRERYWSAMTAADIAGRHLSYPARVCPCCRQTTDAEVCRREHRHPEDNEVFYVPTVEVEFLVVEPGTAKRLHDDAVRSGD